MNKPDNNIINLHKNHAMVAVKLHCRIKAIEDALKSLGIKQELLTDRYKEYLIDRQVRDEDLTGSGFASDIWNEEGDKGTGQNPQKDQ